MANSSKKCWPLQNGHFWGHLSGITQKFSPYMKASDFWVTFEKSVNLKAKALKLVSHGFLTNLRGKYHPEITQLAKDMLKMMRKKCIP